MKLYEGMFVIDNDLVREDWTAAKAVVTGTLEKHGAVVRTARRWDERALAYPIRGRRRATYLLAYFEIEGDKNADVARDLEIQEPVLRYLVTSADEIPEAEVEASEAEGADDFTVPPPPADSVGSYRPIQVESEEEGEGAEGESPKTEAAAKDAPAADGAAKEADAAAKDAPAADGAAAEAPAKDAPAKETPAAGAPAAEGETPAKTDKTEEQS